MQLGFCARLAQTFFLLIMTFRSLALFFLMCLASLASAQHISVESFEPAPTDLAANLKGTMRSDQNGNTCALIRIQTTQKGFSFEVGSLGVWDVDDNKVGEVWVWVPAGVKRISIRHQQLGTLENYKFPVNIEKAKTYVMKLKLFACKINIIISRNQKNDWFSSLLFT